MKGSCNAPHRCGRAKNFREGRVKTESSHPPSSAGLALSANAVEKRGI